MAIDSPFHLPVSIRRIEMNQTNFGDIASPQTRRHRPKKLLTVGLALAAISMLTAMSPIPAQAQQKTSSGALSCDGGIEDALASVTDTKVLLVRHFEQGEPLILGDGADAEAATAVEGTGSASAPVAGVDLCLVKLLVGPGNPGPEDAPSTSAGIGIEVLLPAHDAWNERIRAYGNSGWAGTPQASLDVVASDDIHVAAATKGFVVATSDHGHLGSPIDPSFAMNPDGSINTVGWNDFSERSLHEMADKTKLLTRLFYGREHSYAYWDGFSTGGRQGLKLAQVFADDFEGVLVGSPAINWTRYHTAGLYAQIAMQQDLGYLITPNKLTAATNAAIAAYGGTGLGFLIDPLSCEYDATQDAAILCDGQASNGGTGTSTTETCLTVAEAQVINKIWYGQTADGAAPAPAEDNGGTNILADENRIWFGWTRGTDLATTPAGGAPGVILAADQTALEMQTPKFGSDFLVNATGKGENGWRKDGDVSGPRG
ncbi:tannase/feruloyl esterase family alpha/beta hydrolase [Mesorhizobium sp. A623]